MLWFGYNWNLKAGMTLKFKNILCYGSAHGERMFMFRFIDLKTSYVMVRQE